MNEPAESSRADGAASAGERPISRRQTPARQEPTRRTRGAPTAAPEPSGPAADLARILKRARRSGARALSGAELERLPDLYRFAATELSRARTEGRDPRAIEQLARVTAEAHALLYRDLEVPPGSRIAAAIRFVAHEAPRTIRAEWRLLSLSLVLFYGLALLAYVLVRRDLELAFSLLDGGMLRQELAQLAETTEGQPFRGNFTFGLDESSSTAGMILAHNIGVTLLLFASALLPPLFLLLVTNNALMVGTYVGVASHWGQDGAILSILMCHGTLELQALALGAGAGLALARGLFLPGPRTRPEALRREGRIAWRLASGVIPMLIVAGLIEGGITPHVSIGARFAVMVVSALGLCAWIALGGREQTRSAAPLVEPGAEQHAG